MQPFQTITGNNFPSATSEMAYQMFRQSFSLNGYPMPNAPIGAQVPMTPQAAPFPQWSSLNPHLMHPSATIPQHPMMIPQRVPLHPSQYYNNQAGVNFPHIMQINQWQPFEQNDVSRHYRNMAHAPTRYQPYSTNHTPTNHPTATNLNTDQNQHFSSQQMPFVPPYNQPSSSSIMTAPVPIQHAPATENARQKPLERPQTLQRPPSWNSTQDEQLRRLILEASNEPVAQMNMLSASSDDDVVVIEATVTETEMQPSKSYECTEEERNMMTNWFWLKSHKKNITKKDRAELRRETRIPDTTISAFVRQMRRKMREAVRTDTSASVSMPSTSSQEPAAQMDPPKPPPVHMQDSQTMGQQALDGEQEKEQQDEPQADEDQLSPDEIDAFLNVGDGDLLDTFDPSLFDMK